MDIKIEIKEEEDPLLDDAAPQSEREFFPKDFTVGTNSDAVLLNADCNAIKSETTFPHFFLQNEGECFTEHPLKQIKSETVTCSNICDVNIKKEVEEQTLVSQNERDFFPEDPIMKVKCNSAHEMYNKVFIKEEPWWLERETSSVSEDFKDDEDSRQVESPRLAEAIFGDSDGKALLSTAEVSGKTPSLYNQRNYPECASESNIIEMPTVGKHIHSETSDNCWDEGNQVYWKQKGLIPYKCCICEKMFAKASDLKNHEFIHKGKIFEQRVTQLLHLNMQNMIHKGKKLHKCETCHKTFISLSKLETHSMIHEGKKPYKCNICDKACTQLSNLKRHKLVHEGIKPYKCETCGKSFTQSGSLKVHNLVHVSEKPYRCEICDESFIQSSHLEKHKMIHEGKRPHKCETCDKSFIQLSHLKRHNLIHEGKKAYKCETCDKRFTHLSYLKMHNFIHEGKRPYKCNTCDKSFIRLSHLQKHNMIHYRTLQV